MSLRRFRAATISDNAYSTMYPAPKERVMDFSVLNGGLNLWELDYRLDANQSPDCVNVYWNDGCLSSRKGQDYYYEEESASLPTVACYERLWEGAIIIHKGTSLYKIVPPVAPATSPTQTAIFNGLTTSKGAGFFVFGDKLYYLGGGKYLQITTSLIATEVVPYIPVVVTERKPDGTGGNLYQPENRIATGKEIWFTADGSSVNYILPYQGLDSTTVTAKVLTLNTSTSVYEWIDYTEVPDVTQATGNVFQVDRTNGVVKFKTAPSQSTIETPNNVKIVCYLPATAGSEQKEAIDSIMTCTTGIVFGGDNNLAIVLGGPPAQPNAYFWSGNDSSGLNPGYFPYEYYNFAASDANQYIKGFGKQQNMLIIFSERAVGKSAFSIQTISQRDYLQLPYRPINDSIGCDVSGSIQLVQNNLVFANTYGGVYILADTSVADENNVIRISRNINGEGPGSNRGLLHDLSLSNGSVSSWDDQQRYWIIANGHAYLWDYTIRSYKSGEGNLSWFFFTDINSVASIQRDHDICYADEDGSIVEFIDDFADFGEVIERKYAFSTQNFGTYEALKDVMKVVFSVRSDTDSAMTITYKTDYETRDDLTPIRAWSWRLVPRNLSHRSLRPIVFAMATVRKPHCFHIRHYQMILSNHTIYSDMSLVSAQVFYRYSREDR